MFTKFATKIFNTLILAVLFGVVIAAITIAFLMARNAFVNEIHSSVYTDDVFAAGKKICADAAQSKAEKAGKQVRALNNTNSLITVEPTRLFNPSSSANAKKIANVNTSYLPHAAEPDAVYGFQQPVLYTDRTDTDGDTGTGETMVLTCIMDMNNIAQGDQTNYSVNIETNPFLDLTEF